MKLDTLFRPESIALVGASREPEKVGHRIFKNIVDGGYEGKLYPVNPKASQILGHKCYPSVREIPGKIDLAVICVPAPIVPKVAEECGQKGVGSLVVISAGFSEIGREGTAIERELLRICRKYGMRVQGPNCLGVINVQSRLNASFAATNPPPGNVAFVSQSGALGSTILNWALEKRVGLTSFVSLGNEADLTAADFVEALAEDEETKVIALYVEGVKDGGRFVQVTRRVSKKKPIIALKAGTTDVGMKAVSSHTGSLAGSDTAFTAAFRKAGVLRVATLEELFNLILAFGTQPIPKGGNVLIITNGGGPGILAADACEKMDLELPLLEKDLMDELQAALPPQASVHNPIDVLGDSDEERYRRALRAGNRSKRIDAMIVVLTPQAMTPVDRVADAVVEASHSPSDKPILAVFMGVGEGSAAVEKLQENGVPNYAYPEHAALVVRAMADYRSVLSSSPKMIAKPSGTDRTTAEAILRKASQEGRLSLTVVESVQMAHAWGISVPRAAIATTLGDAKRMAERIGYPLAMKVVSPEIIHKTDFGGVALNVTSATEVESYYRKIVRRMRLAMPDASFKGILLQKMVPPGREVIVGAVRDPQFGPLLMFGLGGIYVNFLRDVSYGLCPLTEDEARRMVEETKAYSLLRGVRGEAPSDIDSVVDTILRVSDLMMEFSDVLEMEINPLFVYEKGCIAVDVRMTISEKKEE